MPKFNQPSQLRARYVSADALDDSLSGKSAENPKASIQAAFDSFAGISPAPSTSNPIQLVISQGGGFSESIVVPDFCSVDGENATISSADPVTIELGNFHAYKVTTIANLRPGGGTVVSINNKDSTGIDSKFLGTFTDNSIGIHIQGVCERLKLSSSRFDLDGVGSVGVLHEGTSVRPVDINFETVAMLSTNQTLIDWNPINFTDSGTCNFSSVTNGLTGSTLFNMQSGRLRSIFNDVDVETFCDVQAGTTLDIIGGSINGDITVRAGGILNIIGTVVNGDIFVEDGGLMNCEILRHPTGTINNVNGTGINGRIDRLNYGTQGAAGALYISIGGVSGANLGDVFQNSGIFELDTNIDKITQVSAIITRTKDKTSTTTIRIGFLDINDPSNVNNGDVYFSGSVSTPILGPIRIDLTEVLTPPSLDRGFFQILGTDTDKSVRLNGVTVNYLEKT